MSPRLHLLVTIGVIAGAVILAPVRTIEGLAMQQEQAPAPTPPAITPPPGTTNRVFGPEDAFAPIGPPPAAGDVILDDPLTGPGVLSGGLPCPTGGGNADFSPEGYRFTVTGPCRPGSDASVETPTIDGLSVPDGEIRAEVRVVTGHEHAQVLLRTRVQTGSPRRHDFVISPRSRTVIRHSWHLGLTPPFEMTMGHVPDDAWAADGWNSLAIRQRGPEVWMLVNDALVLSFVDPHVHNGSVGFGLGRDGLVKDATEVTVVFRNLRVSKLAP
jgi:hypothetical protein